MRKTVSFVLGSMLFLALSGCCKPEIAGTVANTMRPQETNNWCWAATTQMLAQHFGNNVTQCDLANHRFNKSNCCDSQNEGANCPKTNDCNDPGWLELDFVGLKWKETEDGLSWDDLRKKIYCGKKPMGYAYGIPDEVGHVLVIKGYITVGGTRYVILNDPWPRCGGEERLITYEQYENPAGNVTHWRTWYDLAKKD